MRERGEGWREGEGGEGGRERDPGGRGDFSALSKAGAMPIVVAKVTVILSFYK